MIPKKKLKIKIVVRMVITSFMFCQGHARVAGRRLRPLGQQRLGKQRSRRLSGHRSAAGDPIARNRIGCTEPKPPSPCEVGTVLLTVADHACFFQVILGGGRQEFLPKSMNGNREDGQDLIARWKMRMANDQLRHGYVRNKTELSKVNLKNVDKLLGDYNVIVRSEKKSWSKKKKMA